VTEIDASRNQFLRTIRFAARNASLLTLTLPRQARRDVSSSLRLQCADQARPSIVGSLHEPLHRR
jgi:hypothetical protein